VAVAWPNTRTSLRAFYYSSPGRSRRSILQNTGNFAQVCIPGIACTLRSASYVRGFSQRLSLLLICCRRV
jgi:hypothetical protein